MQHQRSYLVFLGLWTMAYAIFTTAAIHRYAGAPLATFLSGESREMTPVSWKPVPLRPSLKVVEFQLSNQRTIKMWTWRERPDESPMPAQKVRAAPAKSILLMANERGWAFGVVRLFMPSRIYIGLWVATGLTLVFWAPTFSALSDRERRRKRERRRQQHKRSSKFPRIWIKTMSYLFIVLSAAAIWWAFSSVLPSGNSFVGWTIIVLAALHLVVLIGTLLGNATTRSLLPILPWTWTPILPIGTLLAIITLATLPNLPASKARE